MKTDRKYPFDYDKTRKDSVKREIKDTGQTGVCENSISHTPAIFLCLFSGYKACDDIPVVC